MATQLIQQYLVHIVVILGIWFIVQAIKIHYARELHPQASDIAFYLNFVLGLLAAIGMAIFTDKSTANVIPMIFLYIGTPALLNASGTRFKFTRIPKIGVLFERTEKIKEKARQSDAD